LGELLAGDGRGRGPRYRRPGRQDLDDQGDGVEPFPLPAIAAAEDLDRSRTLSIWRCNLAI
jgi:hypothetical protein